MSSGGVSDVAGVFDALDAAVDAVLGLDLDGWPAPAALALLRRCEQLRRRLASVEHPLVAAVAATDPSELGGKPAWVLADELLISRGQARRRIAEAADLSARHTLTGESMPPVLPAVAVAQQRGQLGGEHIGIIREFFDYIPTEVDPATRAAAEVQLVELAGQFRPEQLTQLAHRLADCLHPDGQLCDAERARRRGVMLGAQDRHGMSRITGWLTPQARATLDAVLARWAAPGMCNPDDEHPCTDATPRREAIESDRRGAAQRNHDALVALGRAMLASGGLGEHNGLPAAIVVSANLTDLHAAAGVPPPKAHTGGGTWLPITDLLRLASHAHHWLRIYDGAKEVALFHTKRLATPGQRIVLHARERGCSAPGCSVPANLCEVHHITDYATCRDTGIDNLTLACGPHHRQIRPGGYHTRRTRNGTVEWLTTRRPGGRHQPRTNTYHHPEQTLLRNANPGTDTPNPGDGPSP